MRERQVDTQTVKASEARAHWSEILNAVFRRQTRVVVEKSGIPVAIISAEDLERLTQLEQQRVERFAALQGTREAFQDVPDDELEQEVNQAIEQIRAENRRRTTAQQP